MNREAAMGNNFFTSNSSHQNIIAWIFILFLIGSILTGCAPTPQRSISDIDLLIGLDDYPDEWDMYPKKDHLVSEEGQVSGAYVTFYYKDAPVMIRSGEEIYHYKNTNKAKFHYKRLRDLYINDERYYVTTAWESPSTFSFVSSHADDWKFACAGSNFSLGELTGNTRTICTYIARYQEYVVKFDTTIEAEGKIFMTIEQLQSIVEAIDEDMKVIGNEE